jgi:RNA polymerase sigma-70 factor (ECF subfamily)
LETLNNYNEQKLVVALKNGDVNAFNKLFSVYGVRLFSFANGYLKSKYESEEIVQEVFVILWRKRKDLNPELSFKSYLFKIAYHLILEAFKKIAKQEQYKHELLDHTFHSSTNFDERLDYQNLLEKVEKIINELPPRQQQIFILRKKEGIAVKEIARQLNISPKTVENHITEAVKKIKNKLNYKEYNSLLLYCFFCSNVSK